MKTSEQLPGQRVCRAGKTHGTGIKTVFSRRPTIGMLSLSMALIAGAAETGSQVSPAGIRAASAGAPAAVPEPAGSAQPWVVFGGDFRFRDEYMNAAVSLAGTAALHEQNMLRFRERIWLSATPSSEFKLNARAIAEPRNWTKPAFAGTYRARTGMEWRYALVDNLNVKWQPTGGLPFTLTVGRQDILPGELGEGWLVGDGTSGDGSMTFYFDAVRLTCRPAGSKTTVNAVAIYQNPNADGWLPTLGRSSGYPVADQREQGLILYASNQTFKNTRIDAYGIYKHDDQETFTVAGAQKTPGDDADIYTFGGSVTGDLAEHWQYALEGAWQFGWKKDKILGVTASRDLAAQAAKARLSYRFKDGLSNQVSLVGEFLSGDDSGTADRDEMFDVLWGRWPSWSDLYVYSYAAETNGRVSQMNNLGRAGLTWSFKPAAKLTFSATGDALFAPEAAATRRTASTAFSNAGHFRGSFAQVLLKCQFTKHISGHLQGEWVWEGDYYRQRDTMAFLRVETTVTF